MEEVEKYLNLWDDIVGSEVSKEERE